MTDTNMQIAYNWASQLADTSDIRLSTNIFQVALFVNAINELLVKYINKDLESSGSGLFENLPIITREIIFHRLDDLCRRQVDVQIAEQRISIALRLWSGCISAAKTIALDTRDGIVTPDTRKEIFRNIDSIAMKDPIFCLGVEAAPTYKKIHQQCYSFVGVPSSSCVRKYPNEYLKYSF